MSLAKIHTVNKAAKDQGVCDKCKTPLPAGSPYRWYVVGFRSKAKRRRCMAAACSPRPSERESSQLATIYAAQEDFEAAVAEGVDSIDGLEEIYGTFRDAVREYADERREAAELWEHGNAEMEERAETAEQAADELEGWQPEEYGGPLDDDGEPEDTDDFREHLDAQIEEAADHVGGVSF